MDADKAVQTGMAKIKQRVAALPTELPEGAVERCRTCGGAHVCPIYTCGFRETVEGDIVAVGPFESEDAKVEAYLLMSMTVAALTGALA